MIFKVFFIVILSSIIIPFEEPPIALDADSNYYAVIKIGKNWWMAENLRTTRFNDGDFIYLIEDFSKWSDTTSPAYCWYFNNEAEYKNEFGALYNWYAVETKKLCPPGWHIPTDEEWWQLENFIGMSPDLANTVGFRGINEAKKLKKYSELWWDKEVQEATNESGFSAIPSGARSGYNGIFSVLYKGTGWWSSTEYKASMAWMRGINNSGNTIMRLPNSKNDGLSVRCIKD